MESLETVAACLAQDCGQTIKTRNHEGLQIFQGKAVTSWLQSKYNLKKSAAKSLFNDLLDNGFIISVVSVSGDESLSTWFSLNDSHTTQTTESDSDTGSSSSTPQTQASSSPSKSKKKKLKDGETEKSKAKSKETTPREIPKRTKSSSNTDSPHLSRSVSEQSIITVSGDGSLSKLHKLLGQQVVSIDTLQSTNKPSKALGTNTRAPNSPASKMFSSLSSEKLPAGTGLLSPSIVRNNPAKRPQKRPTRLDLDKVPSKLDSPWQTLDTITLLSGGAFVATYKRSGDIEVGRCDQSVYFFLRHKSPIVNLQVSDSFIASFHEDRTLRVYSIAADDTAIQEVDFMQDAVDPEPILLTVSVDRIPAPSPRKQIISADHEETPKTKKKKRKLKRRDSDNSIQFQSDEEGQQPTVESESVSQPSSPRPSKARGAIVLLDTTAVVLVCFAGHYKAFVYGLHQQLGLGGGIFGDNKLELQRIVALIPPESSEHCRVYAVRPQSSKCKLKGDRILIGADEIWQLWDLSDPSGSKLVMYDTPYQEDNNTATSFRDIQWAGDLVAAITIDRCYVWSITEEKRLYTVRSSVFLTELVLDDEAVILGETQGHVIYRGHTQRKVILDPDSKKVHKDQVNASSSTENLLTAADFANKVNCIVRINKNWIACGDESGTISCYLVQDGRGVLGKQFSVGGSVLQLIVDGGFLRALVKKQLKDSKDSEDDENSVAAHYEVWETQISAWYDKVEQEAQSTLASLKAADLETTPSKKKLKTSGGIAIPPTKIQKLLGEQAFPDTPAAALVLGNDVMLKKDKDDKKSSRERRTSIRVKDAAFFPLDIPDVLSNKFSMWNRTHLLYQNFLVTTYKMSGALLLTNASSEVSSVFDNPSPIVCYAIQYPLIFSFHKDDSLQCFSVSTRSMESININQLSNSNSSMEDERDTPRKSRDLNTILMVTRDFKVVVVQAQEDFYLVYTFSYQLEAHALTFDNLITLKPPTKSNEDVQILRLVEVCCAYINDHLVLGNHKEIQLWSLLGESFVRRITAPQDDTIQAVQTNGPLIVAQLRQSLLITSTEEEGVEVIKLRDTVAHVLVTNELIIVGSENGLISIIPHNNQISSLIPPALEVYMFGEVNSPHPAPALRDGKSSKKITCMRKKGKFVFVGHEGNVITVWNIGSNNIRFVKEYPTEGEVIDLKLERTSVNALLKKSVVGKAMGLELMVINVMGILRSEASQAVIGKPSQRVVVRSPRQEPPSLQQEVASLKRQVEELNDALRTRDKKINELLATNEAQNQRIAELEAKVEQLWDFIKNTSL